MSLAGRQANAGRSNRTLISCRDQLGWSIDRAAYELHRIGLENGLPMPDVASVRRTLLRHEGGQSAPRRPDDVYGRVYELAYRRRPEDLFPQLRPATSNDGTFGVTAHQFAPAYIGDQVEALNSAFSAKRVQVGWAECWQARVELPNDEEPQQGTIYLFDWGVAILHVTLDLRPGSITELAVWRRNAHRSVRQRLGDLLRPLLGQPVDCSYVLSSFWLTEPAWTGEDLQTAMRLLCSPRTLLGTGELDLAHAEATEKRLFSEGFAPVDHVDIGTDGISLGWASWAGVSYYPLNVRAALTEEDLISCELLVQGLWCLCDEVQRQVHDGRDPALPASCTWRWLRGQRGRITNAAPNEAHQHRLLRAGVLKTSELPQKLADTVELLKEIGS
jgi:hypothetical protein